jgi:hypothetical protein
MNPNERPPPVGESADALILHVLRTTVAQLEKDLAEAAARIANLREENLRMKQLRVTSAVRQMQTIDRLRAAFHELQSGSDRVIAERDTLVKALERLQAACILIAPGNIPDRFAGMWNRTLRETEEVLSLIRGADPK